MSTYIIGDVHGCYDELITLLKFVNYQENKDQLWFVGDLINRGSKSLQTLRFIKNLTNAVVTLGNHDLHLLALYNNKDPLFKEHTLHEILHAPDAAKLINWLRNKPLLHYDQKLNCVMTHAGIYPKWDLQQAITYTKEVEAVLKSDNYVDLLAHMYGNEPILWNDDLTGNARLRFIINSFTRMRFCTTDAELELTVTDSPSEKLKFQGLIPWFQVPGRRPIQETIVFGHWAALRDAVTFSAAPNVYALDSGCVYGSKLTAMRLEDNKFFSQVCR